MTETIQTNRPGALIAMSGGVDSSVAAWLMQQKGYDCTGITLLLRKGYRGCRRGGLCDGYSL